jgi:hypothetical protein
MKIEASLYFVNYFDHACRIMLARSRAGAIHRLRDLHVGRA